MKAIVIDDSRAIRSILGKMMKDLGFEVFEGSNGLEGLKVLEAQGALDVALVDWNMPEMNGLEFVKAVRAEPKFGSMRIMMVTTETETSQMVAALEAGANEYVMKPFTKEVIGEKLGLMGVSKG